MPGEQGPARRAPPPDGYDIDSWMVDTAHDGANFFPRLFYAPVVKKFDKKTKKRKYFDPLKRCWAETSTRPLSENSPGCGQVRSQRRSRDSPWL